MTKKPHAPILGPFSLPAVDQRRVDSSPRSPARRSIIRPPARSSPNAPPAARPRSTPPSKPPPPRFPPGAKPRRWSAPASSFKFQGAAGRAFRGADPLNTREHGKTLAESRGDVKRGIEMIEFACGIPSLLMGEAGEPRARHRLRAIRQPLGVCAGITPFNFPAMVPLWMYPVALACGNTFVLKPSEKVPLTAIRIVRTA
jgi:hypothetical protein